MGHFHSHEHGCRSRGERFFQFMGRRGGPGGFGPFGRGPMGGRGGGDPFRVGRMVGDGDLRLIVLSLIETQPRHGYDVIKAIEELTSGAYAPSPGVVYPTLTFLDEAGLADATTEGNKKVYAITEAGRSHLAANRAEVDALLDHLKRIGARIAQARAWFGGEGQDGRGERPDRDIPGVVPELNAARRALKAAIAARMGGSEAEQRRVADILARAAEEIGRPAPDAAVDL
ncbi:PadR family transcriptional regulator [Prosthecomicrobium pneumaticum]|uniref:DNA-binding PadR family transcriptional regulator n=1 Tax=Prosthecomicrobium pneumaticum TaxID=81895 RepID=A0A7W9L3C9_9HYPH|nr:PadR family transcriptional regulator [Prosthecomicrobium pneumaticum]MBB5754433.1 DNA-binding PadR family transcriptional regulator [Prosthecomicrobium pneumaticum]